MGGVDEPGLPTLYEWAGGLDPLRRMIDSFYDRVEADDALAGFFPGGVSQRHREHVTDWWAEVLGGPTTYTDRHGGYESMLRHHVGLDITPAQRHRFAATMSLAADDADLPADRAGRGAGAHAAVGLGRRAALPGMNGKERRMASHDTYADLGEAAWRWVLDQVRWDDGPWIPETVPHDGGPPEERDGMHSGIGGLAHVLAEVREARSWTDEEQRLADGIVDRVRGRLATTTAYSYFDGLVSDLGVLSALQVDGSGA